MSDDMIVNLNCDAAYERQDHLCFRCKANMEADRALSRMFYWLDETHNECYCEKCGMDIEKEVKEDD